MTASRPASRRKSRLNPFVFPSDTSLRIILLFVFVIAADILQWSKLAIVRLDFARDLEKCLQGAPFFSMPIMQDLAKSQKCYTPLLSYQNLTIGLGLLLLTAATGTIYWWYPVWEARRLRLTPLDPAEAPGLSATLRELCVIAGLRHWPEFLWNPVNTSHLALAFGRGGTYRVGLTGALALLHHTDPAAFRAVLLHELAHIRNGDVERAYIAMALWWGFLLTAVPPYLFVELVSARSSFDAADAAGLLVEATLITGIVLFTRNAVLRARELYADARSFAWCRDEATFTRIFAGLRPVKGMRRLFSPHPSPARRRRLLDDTDEMFRFGFWDAFGAGAAASFIWVTFEFLVGAHFLQSLPMSMPIGTGTSFAVFVVPIAIWLPLVAGAASIAMWRTTLLALLRGETVRQVIRIAFALAAGVVLVVPTFLSAAILISATGGPAHQYVEQIAAPWSSILVAALGVTVLLTILLIGALVLFLQWVEACATSWLSVLLYSLSPRGPFWIGILVSSVLALSWFSLACIMFGVILYWLAVKHFSTLSIFWFLLIGNASFPANLITWVALVAFWGFPLSAGLWGLRGERKAYAEWPFLDAAPAEAPPIERPLRVRRALLIGLFGGLAAGVALPWLRLPLPPGALHEVGFPETALAAMIVSMALTSMAAQGAIAAVVALAVPKLLIPHAMFAAFVAGWLLTAAEALHLPTAMSLSSVVDVVLTPVVSGGALFALIVSSIMSALRLLADTTLGWLRSRHCACH